MKSATQLLDDCIRRHNRRARWNQFRRVMYDILVTASVVTGGAAVILIIAHALGVK